MTLENIAWIVGVHLGTMHESQAEWAKKLKSPLRIRRIYQARSICYLVLYEARGVSYTEIAELFQRAQSVISRSLHWARDWAKENPEKWAAIQESVKASMEAEQEAHAAATNLKV